MFASACRQYWSLRHHVGSSERGATGLGCALSSDLVLTAHHVYQGSRHPVAVSATGIWRCRQVREWPDEDLALLRKCEQIKRRGDDPDGPFPRWASQRPNLGQSLGFLASLAGKTYFGQGHVAFFDGDGNDGGRFGLAGTLVERGFSGGPVFDPDGLLVGVLVQSYQFVTNLDPQTLVSMPLFSPIASIADCLQRFVAPDQAIGR